METQDLENIWDRFVHLCAIESFGEKEVILEGKRQVNFLGSVGSHKKIFMKAAAEYLEESKARS